VEELSNLTAESFRTPPKSRTTNSTHLLDLPDEVLSLIFSFLDPFEAVRRLSRVCPRFKSIVRDRVPWPLVDLSQGQQRQHSAAKSIFRAGHFDAESVRLPVTAHAVFLDDRKTESILQSFLQLEWNRLRRVTLPMGKGVSNLVSIAPGLVELKLVTPKVQQLIVVFQMTLYIFIL
jgi:hypothetical protein